MLPYILTPTSITVIIDGTPKTADESHPYFSAISDAIRDQDWDAIPDLIDVTSAVQTFVSDTLEVTDGQVLYQGEPLHNAAVDRLLSLMAQGFDVQPLVAFLENVTQNPDARAVSGLYDWLERGRLPISEDGCIIAYKIVGENYKDIYTGTFDNSVGAVCEMPRFRVDDNPDRTCSAGLHFCSAEYLPHYGWGGHRVMLVKVNPRDVVAFPRDYNISKGRCCRYEVIQEVDRETAGSYFDNAAVYQFDDDSDDQLVDPWDDEGTIEDDWSTGI